MLSWIRDMSYNYTWIIIALGSQPSLEKKCLDFATEFLIDNRIGIYHLRKEFKRKGYSRRSAIDIYHLNYDFPLDAEDPDEFCSIITDLVYENKKIILLFPTLPQIPRAFVVAAYTNKAVLGSSLFVVGSFKDESITVIYNPLFLLDLFQQSQTIEGLWGQSGPSQYLDFKQLTDNLNSSYPIPNKSEVESNRFFRSLARHFFYMGQLVPNFSLLIPLYLRKKYQSEHD